MRPRSSLSAIALIAFGAGVAMAALCVSRDLALSFDDARSRLVVARRVWDSLSPGIAQIGLVWLPLPPFLSTLPSRVDVLYRTGLAASAWSVLGFTAAVTATAALVRGITGSTMAAIGAALVLGANPNLLYLAGTPMTEAVVLGSLMTGLALAVGSGGATSDRREFAAGVLLGAACLTRYEAWPVVAAIVVAAAVGVPRSGRWWRLAAGPACAVIGFVVVNRVTTSDWLITSGFFPPTNVAALGRPLVAAAQVLDAARVVCQPVPLAVAALAVIPLLVRKREWPRRWEPAALWLACVPSFVVYEHGHAVNLRFAVVVLPAVAVWVGLLLGALTPRWRLAATVAASVISVSSLGSPFNAPVAWEAQANRAVRAQRAEATACYRALAGARPRVVASMTSVVPYLHDLAPVLDLDQVVHEGTGEPWRRALNRPEDEGEWILLADGDQLETRWRRDPLFATGFREVCRGGDVTWLRRSPGVSRVADGHDGTGGARLLP